MKKLVILSASPKKGEPSVSAMLSELSKDRLDRNDLQAEIIDVSKALSHCEAAFESMRTADALLIIFPLYIFCMPGMLTRFLEDYAASVGQKRTGQKIYTVVNCGFPEPDINEEAIRVIKSFSHHIGAEFRFGVGFGCGGMVLGAKDAPFMKKAMEALYGAVDRMTADILHDIQPPTDTVNISVSFPKWMYFFGGNFGWKQLAKKNGLKKRDLYRTPYRAE
jgi:hypothetical protein